MIRAAALPACVALAFLAAGAAARPPTQGRHPHPAASARPAPPLAVLPVIARIRIEAARDHVLVVHDVILPRGEWTSGDLDLFVSFGAPGVPRAFDARLYAVDSPTSLPRPDDAGEAIAVERAPHRPPSAQVLLGKAQMAGAILHVKEASFERALLPGDAAVVRVRALLDLPAEDAHSGREIVARLGVAQGPPLALGRIELVSVDPRPFVTRAEAQLCGAEADPYPLAIDVSPRPASTMAPLPRPLAPLFALRHGSDDLCVRFWTR